MCACVSAMACKLSPWRSIAATISLGLVARVDADGAARLLAPDDARVLLEGRDGYLLDDHLLRKPSPEEL